MVRSKPSEPTQRSRVFISYRRDDCGGHAGRLYDKLCQHFGADRIFMDIDTIELGEDFKKAIEDAVGSCDVLLALIGKNWLSSTSDGTSRRLDKKDDFVRLEIATALKRGIRVIPILVQGAAMPSAEDLPNGLREMSSRNALSISDLHWKSETYHLIEVIEKNVSSNRSNQPSTPQRRPVINKRIIFVAVAVIVGLGLGAIWILSKVNIVDGPVSQIRDNANDSTTPTVMPSALPTATPASGVVSATPNLPQRAIEPKPLVTNRVGIELVYIPPGKFIMGSENGDPDEKPVRWVTIRNGFYMGRYEVTQAQWQAVMAAQPSEVKGDQSPVEQVSWYDVQEFLRRLTAQNDGFMYRLPSEAEWEYACRAGTTGDYAGRLDEIAWYANNSGRQYIDMAQIFQKDRRLYSQKLADNGNLTHPVGQMQSNAFGLYDMHGNVWEWCEDYYHGSYSGAPTDGSPWLSGGDGKRQVLRGGSWLDHATTLRSASRHPSEPEVRYKSIGLRVVAVARR